MTEETKHEHQGQTGHDASIKSYIMLIMVAVLLLLSVVEAIQISTIKSNIKSGAVAVSASASQSQQLASAPQPSQLQMVGGC